MSWLLKMIKLLAVTVFISSAMLSSASGQVDTPEARVNLLQGLRSTLDNTNREAADYSDLRTPFAPPPVEEVIEDTTEVAAPAVQRSRLRDSEALGIISQQFKPLGSLILGSRAVLQLQSGKTIRRGDTFSASIGGHTYDVVIEDITEKVYTLKLGSAEVSKNFTTTSGASR